MERIYGTRLLLSILVPAYAAEEWIPKSMFVLYAGLVSRFYPDRPDIVAELQGLAAQLHGQLEVPRLGWKYAWMKPIFGLKTARRAQVMLPQLKASLVRFWDNAIFALDNCRIVTSHAKDAVSVAQKD